MAAATVDVLPRLGSMGEDDIGGGLSQLGDCCLCAECLELRFGAPDVPTLAWPASTLEGKLIPGLKLGPLAMLQQRLRVGGKDFTLIMPADKDVVYDMYAMAEMCDSDPYWTRTWPSSIALASLILARPELVKGKKVADVGCGLGLAGIAAAMAGASQVVLLDREPLALRCALISAAASGLLPGIQTLEPEPLEGAAGSCMAAAGIPAAGAAVGTGRDKAHAQALAEGIASGLECHGAVVVANAAAAAAAKTVAATAAAAAADLQPLRAGESMRTETGLLDFRFEGPALAAYFPTDIAEQQHGDASLDGDSTAALPCAVRARAFDWNHAELLAEKFDVLLACDVLYEDAAVQPIAELVPRLLSCSPGSCLLLADPPTRTAHNRERFLQLLEQAAEAGSTSQGAPLVVREDSLHSCESQQLDNQMLEMLGGSAASQSIPIQLMLLCRSEC